MTDKTPHVYSAIAAVSAALAKEGIAKNQKNQQQGFRFRGIDDVLNAMAGLLSAHNLVIVPDVTERIVTERATRSGGHMSSITVKVVYRLFSAVDGSATFATVYGEAMDTADKATSKAMSAAYKYMAIQTFAIPVEGEQDADATTPDTTTQTLPPVVKELFASIRRADGTAIEKWCELNEKQHKWICDNAPADIEAQIRELA